MPPQKPQAVKRGKANHVHQQHALDDERIGRGRYQVNADSKRKGQRQEETDQHRDQQKPRRYRKPEGYGQLPAGKRPEPLSHMLAVERQIDDVIEDIDRRGRRRKCDEGQKSRR